MGISMFLEVNYDFARQHSLKKLDVSRTSENPGNHSIGTIFFCRGGDVLTEKYEERTERLDTRRFMTHATRKFVTQKQPATQEEMAGQVPSSRLLFPEEEIRERFRVRRSHSGHVVPARIRVQAVIGSE